MQDQRIIELFKMGLGARKIARTLGYKHHATVSRQLMRLGLSRNSSVVPNGEKSLILFGGNGKLDRAAESYLKFRCDLAGFEWAQVHASLPYDLLVDFGSGWRRVQIKSSGLANPSGNFIFNVFHRQWGNGTREKVQYSLDDVDYFFLFDQNKNSWLIPSSLLVQQITITPELRFPGFKLDRV